MKKRLLLFLLIPAIFAGCSRTSVETRMPGAAQSEAAQSTPTAEAKSDMSKKESGSSDPTAKSAEEVDAPVGDAETKSDTSKKESGSSDSTTKSAEEVVTHPTEVDAPVGDVVEIDEKLFIAQTNDIYLNTSDYLGKTIKYEGIFLSSYWEDADTTYYFVIRYGPGCCGYDGTAGFEISWDGALPQDNDWCEAVGDLERYEEDGMEYLRLVLSSLTVLEERGSEYVAQ